VVLFAGRGAFPAETRNGDGVVVRMHLDVGFAHTRQFGGQDKCVRGLVDVNRRNPTALSGRIPVQPLLNDQQISQRIPSGERHTAS